MKKLTFKSSLLVLSVAALPAVAQNELFEFSSIGEGTPWDAVLHEPSNSGNYFLDNQGPLSTDAFIMQPGIPPTQLILFRDFEGNGISDGPNIDINAVLTVQDAGGVDQDFVVNSFDWRSVFRVGDPILGRASITGMNDGEMVWEMTVGHDVIITVTDGEIGNQFLGEIDNLDQTIDSMVWSHPDYVDNVWNPSSLDNLDITIAGGTTALEGDYDGNGFVSQADLDLVLLNWGDAALPAGFDPTAIPGGGPFDSLISQNELDGVLLNWGDGTPPAGVAAIPEPTSFALLGLAGAAALRRRR